VNLHRNNAAEWLMWFALWPVVLVVRCFEKKITAETQSTQRELR
jgi:hypothetical protein